MTTKRGGARPGAGQPRKPAEMAVSVRFSLALTPAEADEYRRRGATTWVRRMLQDAIAHDGEQTLESFLRGDAEKGAKEFWLRWERDELSGDGRRMLQTAGDQTRPTMGHHDTKGD